MKEIQLSRLEEGVFNALEKKIEMNIAWHKKCLRGPFSKTIKDNHRRKLERLEIIEDALSLY